MKILNKNLKDFFLSKKKFLLVQFIIILIFTSIFSTLNFKKSFHYKVNYLLSYNNQELLSYRNSYNKLFRDTVSALYDPNAVIDNLAKKGLKINFKDPEKFLDLGYSDVKDIFFVKKSKLDAENEKIEIVSRNKNFKIEEYKIAHNKRIQNYLISEKYNHENTLKDIKEYINRLYENPNPFFDEYFYRYDTKYSIIKDLVGEENIILTDDIGFFYHECTKDYSGYPDEFFFKLSHNITFSLAESVTKKIDITNFNAGKFLNFLNCSLEKNLLKAESEKFFLREKLIKLINKNADLEKEDKEELEKINKEILETVHNYFIAPNKPENDNFKIYFLKKDKIKQNLKIILENDKKKYHSNIDILIKQIGNDINDIRTMNFIEFKELYSEYALKYKILEIIKYFIFFIFIGVLFNINYYFFFNKKIKND